ncbi:hypothetical protein Gorai_023151, partial [Gossypium raimondii]|nr:hypothetical protein [Gossypium raimondii]
CLGCSRSKVFKLCLAWVEGFSSRTPSPSFSIMEKDINVLLERLNFSEEESKRVISTNKYSTNPKGYEVWAVGKIMSKEKINREAMYRVFKSLWFTKEEVSFVALPEGTRFGRICFNITPFWVRIYNIPVEQMDRQMAIDVGEAIGVVLAMDWRDRDGGWAKYIIVRVKIDVLKPVRRVVHLVGREETEIVCIIKVQPGGTAQGIGNWRNGIEILESKTNHSTETNDVKERNGDENDPTRLKEKEKVRTGEEESESGSTMDKRPTKLARDGRGRARCKRKRIRVGNGENIAESLARLVRRKLADNLSPCKAVAVGRSVREAWIVGGDFNAIINEAEKEGGRRKSRASMEEFREVMEELSMVDIKTDKGWFTWVNNREGNAMVKERLDRFLISANDFENFSFLKSRVVRQSKSDHDAIVLDTVGHKLNENFRDPRLFFKNNVCWEKEEEAKNIIKNAWSWINMDTLEKLEKLGLKLGQWQHRRYKRMKNQVGMLTAKINNIIDGPNRESNASKLKMASMKLGHPYDKCKILSR